MKIFLFFTLFALGLMADVKDSIVKIYTVSKVADYMNPWNSKMSRSHGSGVIIDGNRILTNAHVVANETFLEVKRHGDTKRYEAEVAFISHQADLAVLYVKDDHFFDNTQPLKFGSLPLVQQKVTAYGFAMGGNSLSVSTGVVSRIEHHRYAHSGEIFLAIQIDAAVNPGNSGGPIISDDKIVGIVMQQIRKSQNISYVVPTPVIKHFLDDIEDGVYNGFAHLGFGSQKMENKALRDVYKMQESQTGVMVIDISQKSSAYGVLEDGDIILSIDSHSIENDGTVEFMPQQFTSFVYYVDAKQLGESVTFEVLRDGKVKKIALKLTNVANDDLLVDTLEHDRMPRYYIYGGYVFTPLTRNLLMQSRSTLLQLREAATKWETPQKEEVVVLLKVLADESNRGNHEFSLWMIDTLNHETFKNFKEFVEKLSNTQCHYTLLQNKGGVKVAIDNKKAKEIEQTILQRYGIKSIINKD